MSTQPYSPDRRERLFQEATDRGTGAGRYRRRYTHLDHLDYLDFETVTDERADFIEAVFAAVVREAGSEYDSPKDAESEPFCYAVKERLLIRVSAVEHIVIVSSAYAALGRLRYRIEFPNGCELAVTQAQLLRLVIRPVYPALPAPEIKTSFSRGDLVSIPFGQTKYPVVKIDARSRGKIMYGVQVFNSAFVWYPEKLLLELNPPKSDHIEPDGTCPFMVENQYRISLRMKWMREPDWLVAAYRDWRDHPETRWQAFEDHAAVGDVVILGRLDSEPVTALMLDESAMIYQDLTTFEWVESAPIFRVHVIGKGVCSLTKAAASRLHRALDEIASEPGDVTRARVIRTWKSDLKMYVAEEVKC